MHATSNIHVLFSLSSMSKDTWYRSEDSSIQIADPPAQAKMMTSALMMHPTMVPINVGPLRVPPPSLMTSASGLHIS